MVILLLLWRAEGYHQSAVGHLSPFIHECRTYYLNSRFTAYQYSRFADWDDPNHRPAQMVGYRKNPKAGCDEGVTFYVLPEGWREINNGRDYKKAAKLSLSLGWIIHSQNGKTQTLARLPGLANKPTRVYLLNSLVLSE